MIQKLAWAPKTAVIIRERKGVSSVSGFSTPLDTIAFVIFVIFTTKI